MALAALPAPSALPGSASASRFDLGEDRQAGLADLLSHLAELAALGIDHVLVAPRQSWDEATFDAIASILPQVHAAVLASMGPPGPDRYHHAGAIRR